MVQAGNKTGVPATIIVDPPNDYIQLINQSKVTSSKYDLKAVRVEKKIKMYLLFLEMFLWVLEKKYIKALQILPCILGKS